MDINAALIGEVLRSYRNQAGLTQEVLSGLAGLDRTHYSKIERGLRMPTIKSIFQIAYALKLHPTDIIAAIEEKCGYEL